eukprot:366154-Chlamydomonas_euryale.AAC.8
MPQPRTDKRPLLRTCPSEKTSAVRDHFVLKSVVQPHSRPPSSADTAPRPMLAGPRASTQASGSPLA